MGSIQASEALETQLEEGNVFVSLKNPPSSTSGSTWVSSLNVLHRSTMALCMEKPSGGTLQSVIDLTAYISSQTYAHLSRPSAFRTGIGAVALSAEEEEVRKEIRSLKGLVLNRCVATDCNTRHNAVQLVRRSFVDSSSQMTRLLLPVGVPARLCGYFALSLSQKLSACATVQEGVYQIPYMAFLDEVMSWLLGCSNSGS